MKQTSKATLTIKDGKITEISLEACNFFNKLPEQVIGQSFATALENIALHTQSGFSRTITTNPLDDHTYQVELNQPAHYTNYADFNIIYQFISPLIDRIIDPLLATQIVTETLIQDDTLSPERQDEYLHNILNTVKSLSLLFDGIKAYGKDVCLETQDQWEQINLRSFCRKLIDEQMTKYSHVTCEVDFQGDNQNAIVQPHLFQNIIENLLSNAAKYSPSHSIIHITVQSTDNSLIIIIEDHGLGMTNMDMQNLYTPFYKGKIARESTDAGLGLAIVKHSVDVHQGTIHFDSVIDQGTTVTVTIPNRSTIEDSRNEKALQS